MLTFPNRKIVAIGEVMVELAPVEGGLYARSFAGDTYNTAWHMAQLLGLTATVGYASRVGSDNLSAAFLHEAKTDGLDVEGISTDPERGLGLYLIELEGFERSFHYWRSQSAARNLANNRAGLQQAIGQAGLIHLSGITLAILSETALDSLFDILATARKAGSIISFDPNIRLRIWSSAAYMRETVRKFLPLVDIALPSFDDEATHWNDRTPSETIERLAAAGVSEIIVKNGPGTVTYRCGDQDGEIGTPPVKDILDTTGAGDAFNAGYLAARLNGVDCPGAIARGQELSALVICHPGARAPRALVRQMLS